MFQLEQEEKEEKKESQSGSAWASAEQGKEAQLHNPTIRDDWCKKEQAAAAAGCLEPGFWSLRCLCTHSFTRFRVTRIDTAVREVVGAAG